MMGIIFKHLNELSAEAYRRNYVENEDMVGTGFLYHILLKKQQQNSMKLNMNDSIQKKSLLKN
jgi:hypothetical protein